MLNLIDRISGWTGKVVAWLTLAMVVLTFVIVVMRYVFDSGHIWMQEIVTWMHAAVFMLGAAYALSHEQHVRVDVFYRKMTPRGQALVNIAGTALLLFPLCGFLIWISWDYVAASWSIREASRQANGLGYPALSLLKTMLIVMPLLLMLQGLSLAGNAIQMLRGKSPEPGERDTPRSEL